MSMEVCRHVTGRQRSMGQSNKCQRYVRGCFLVPHWAQVLENAMGKNASERPEDMQELCAFICTAQTAISQVTHTRASTCMRARAEKHTHGSAHTRHVQISGKSDEFWTNLWGWHEESGGSDTIEFGIWNLEFIKTLDAKEPRALLTKDRSTPLHGPDIHA
jgi:hypothetical protein